MIFTIWQAILIYTLVEDGLLLFLVGLSKQASLS